MSKKPTKTAAPVKKPTNLKLAQIVNAELPFMYASKSAEYVFGTEVGDGFITLSIPKDRFSGDPKVVLVQVHIVE